MQGNVMACSWGWRAATAEMLRGYIWQTSHPPQWGAQRRAQCASCRVTSEKTHFTPGVCTCSVASGMSDSLRPSVLQPARLLCPRNSPGKNTGVGCHVLLQGIFPTQGSNPCLLSLLHCRQILYPLSHLVYSSPKFRQHLPTSRRQEHK